MIIQILLLRYIFLLIFLVTTHQYFRLLAESTKLKYSAQDHFNEKSSKSVVRCNPQTQGLFAKFFIQRWMDARNELGMNQLQQDDTSTLYEKIFLIMSRFNSFNPGANLFFTASGIPVPYVVMWKCISEGIIANLGRLSSIPRYQFIKSLNTFETIIAAHQNKTSSIDSQLQVFTVVRDPFSRFISGFTEAVYLTYKKRKFVAADGVSPLQTNISAVKAHIQATLDFKLPLDLMGHFYPMAGVLFQFDIHLLGHFENFKTFWSETIQPVYHIKKKYAEIGMHVTSVNHPKASEIAQRTKMDANRDPNNARKALSELLQSDKKYKRAICHLLLVDYVCLPMYDLPVECHFLNRTRDAAINAVSKGRVIPHKIVH